MLILSIIFVHKLRPLLFKYVWLTKPANIKTRLTLNIPCRALGFTYVKLSERLVFICGS